METAYTVLRWIHMLAASAWFGEVVVINFVLIPVVSKFDGVMRSEFVTKLFPRIFRLASVLSATAVLTGFAILYIRVDGDFGLLLRSGSWGHSLLFGSILGTLLTFFHFFIENRMARKIGIVREAWGEGQTSGELEDVHLRLKIIPRLGLGVITIIFLSMTIAAHGF